MDGLTRRARIRVLLCGPLTFDAPSLLAEIATHEVFGAEDDPVFEVVRPRHCGTGEARLVPMDLLRSAVDETAPDVVLVLADESAVSLARRILAPRYPRTEVIGVTRGGHALFNLDPRGLRELLRHAVASRRSVASGGGE